MTENPSHVEQAVAKAKVLMEALPYIREFRGSTVVIKYGGSAMILDELKEKFAQDVVLLASVGINPVIVHGGGPEITALMERLGLEAEFHEGQRVTDAQTLEITEMVLAGKLNGEIVSRINRAGGRAVGLSGRDGSLILAKKMENTGERDIGFVGDVDRIDPTVLNTLAQADFVPVISPIGIDAEGQTYNINADLVAAEIAGAIEARKLVLLTDVSGILRDPGDPESRISTIEAEQIQALIADKVIQGGMIPKVNACIRALLRGVKKTHILDGRLHHSTLLELFTDEGIGTQIQ